METLLQSNQTLLATQIEKNTLTSGIAFWEKLESNRFGIIPMLLVIIGCFGGIAAAFGAQADIFKLALVALPSAIATALVLGLAPMKAVVWMSSVAVILDMIILILS